MSKAEVREAWSKVGDELSGLGLKLKYHVEEEFADDDDDDELRSSLKRFTDALEDAADAVADAANDPAVHEDLRNAGRLLVKAVNASLNEARSELRTGK